MDHDIEPLVEQAKAGDERALVQLFDQHRDRLMRMVNLRMDRRIQARVSESDVLQEAYVDLAQQLPNYAKDPKLPFFLWLRRITGQRLAKIHRRHLGQAMRDAGREVALDRNWMPDASSALVAFGLIDQFTSAAAKAVRVEILEKIQEALETMPEQDREVISLRHSEQLSNEEIAIVLDVTNKAASMRYTRAILRLKEMLEKIPGILD